MASAGTARGERLTFSPQTRAVLGILLQLLTTIIISNLIKSSAPVELHSN